MKIHNFFLLALCPLACTACFKNSARIDQMESQLVQVEEKVDALLTYSNSTHDAITDIDVRMAALEQDAKKRGVPVRTRGVDLAYAREEIAKVQGYLPPPPQNAIGQTQSSSQLITEPPQASLTGEQALLAQSPTLAALQSISQEQGSSALPEKDMNARGGNSTPQSQKAFTDGYEMAEGVTLRIPSEDTQQFQYPEHTQDIAPVTTENLASQNSTALVGPITGQNLQAPVPMYSSVDDIPEPVSLTPKPANTLSNTAAAPTTPATQQVASAPINTAQSTGQTVGQTTPMTATYDGAMTLYKARKYEDAEKAFDSFLAANPGSPLAPNAMYWKGETFYARGLYPQAIFAFKEVQTRYPKHSKAPDSLLKTGMSYENLGDMENASLHYLVLTEDFPGSSAAKRAPQ